MLGTPNIQEKVCWTALPAQSGSAADSSQTFQFQGIELLSHDPHLSSRGLGPQDPSLGFWWDRDVLRAQRSRLDESDGVTAAKGFKAAGMYGGLRALGEKPDLALVTCDVDAISAGQLP